MAKIISVDLLLNTPDVIDITDNQTDITVTTKLQFHEPDIKGKLDYYLHLFVYDVHSNVDPPVIIANWDESYVIPVETSLDHPDDFLGTIAIHIQATEKEMTIETPMTLKLGNIRGSGAYYVRNLEVFATAVPMVSRVSKWSKPSVTTILR
ncbi:hypothetical protein [Bizionia arctica]|uniref:Uncharacterized protein n=1 Tax=Bizionia arctica TaxID=1495645 RepID=A0A917LPH1_9FLAO|nr:hypothetical protein [Bizionia arctica]GGG48965.1 hypothetical protein GCM10010976_20380 [Bizionia arctica]